MPPCIGFSGSLFVRACQPHTHAPYKQTSVVLYCIILYCCVVTWVVVVHSIGIWKRERKREEDVRLCAYDI